MNCERCGTKRESNDDLIIENLCAEGNLGAYDCCIRNICIDVCEFLCQDCGKKVVDGGARSAEVSRNHHKNLPNDIDFTKEILKISHNENKFVCRDCYEKNHKNTQTYPINEWYGMSWSDWVLQNL